ncbi:MAG: hypothetical protein FJX11_24730, partial [Alphaproteobacteria bacterium]|nr:hypothetical protein [Alphaproteobacteria bacterium]
EASPSTTRTISRADIVIANGAASDLWMLRLLAASPNPTRTVMVVADLVGAKAGGNPHLWYDPSTMPALASAWSGLVLAFYTDWPASFWITVVAASGYLFAWLLRTMRSAAREAADAR